MTFGTGISGLLGAAALMGSAIAANAAVVRVTEANFNAGAGLITFSEFGLGTVNPTYAPADYGGGAGAPIVTTGGYFEGQSLSANAAVARPGAAATGCVVGTPNGPLTLDANAPNVFITQDGAFPTSPTLSGTPRFNGPIALLFDTDQLAVGFEGGFFDAAESTAITAFARDGSLLGRVSNQGTGIEFLGLVSATGMAEIAGVFLELVGAEPSGYNIDNVRFGVAGDIILPPDVNNPSTVPLPAGLPLLAGGLGFLAFGVRRRAGAK